MEMRRAGKSGLEISRLGLGTMTWGRDTDTHEAAEQMRSYIEAGGNFIDTAASYAAGDAERVIGGLVGTFFNREDVVIATKAGVSFPEGVRTVNNSRHFLIGELEKSLTRLGTDYVDIWQIHSWDPNVALEDTLSALDFAYTSGKARYVGISNFNGWQSARAISLQEANTAKAPIATIQSEPMTLASETDILPAIQKVIKANFPELMLKLTNHWNNVATNGLQIKLRINLSNELVSSKNMTFETRIGEDAVKLQEILTKWVSLNAKNKRYSPGSQTKNVINYNSISIPLETPDKSGKNNAKLFAEQLVTYIYKTLKFDGEVSSSGPGNATIILK